MVRTLLFFILFTFSTAVLAQETIEVTHSRGGIVEKYHVLKSNEKIKQGFYQMFTRKNIAIATGTYNEGKRSGKWHFFGQDGKVVQFYDYTGKKLYYEASPDSVKTYIQYTFDKKVTDKDTVSRPVIIGGIYFGYIPYVALFKIDPTSYYLGAPVHTFLELLVSPLGHLAECRLVVKLKSDNSVVDSYLLNTDLLNDENKQFIPAMFNGQPVTSTISILVKINSDFTISLYD